MTKQASHPAIGRAVAEIVKPDPIRPEARKLEFVDTDFHFLPEWKDLRKYVPEPWYSQMERLPPTGIDYSPDQANYGYNKFTGTGQDKLGIARNAADVIRTLDQIGVEKVVLTPGFTGTLGWFNEPMISVVARAYNDYLANEVLPISDRIFGNIYLNQRAPADGAAEIRRVGGNEKFAGVYGVFGARSTPIGNVKFDPVFDAMAEFGLPLTMHAGGFPSPGTPIWDGMRTWTELFGVSPMGTCMTYVASMIVQGVFDKYPNLKVVLQEGGIWWAQELALRMDEFYLGHSGDIRFVERKLAAGEKFLYRLPSEYLWDNFRFATQPMCIPQNEKHFEYLLELTRAEQTFVYSSDWPHATYDPTSWVVQHPKVIPPAMQKKIAGGNAKKVYTRTN